MGIGIFVRALLLSGLVAASEMSSAAEGFVAEKVFVDNVRVLLRPFPAAVVFGNYPSGCVTSAGRPTLIQNGNNVDIRVTARRPAGAVCAAILVPFVEAVSLANVANPAGLSYSVNGVPVAVEVDSKAGPAR